MVIREKIVCFLELIHPIDVCISRRNCLQSGVLIPDLTAVMFAGDWVLIPHLTGVVLAGDWVFIPDLTGDVFAGGWVLIPDTTGDVFACGCVLISDLTGDVFTGELVLIYVIRLHVVVTAKKSTSSYNYTIMQ